MSLLLRNIIKDFDLPGAKQFRAVDGVSLDLADGKLHAFLGPSGCGKTTLLRMIAGFETPSSGELSFHGLALNQVPANLRGFSMVFQSYALFPHATVAENIGYGLKLKKLAKAEIASRVHKMVELLGLQANEKKYPSQLSGGQQQRVALARALVMEPKLLLFDEPLSNLDAKLRVFMREEIRALQKRLGITAVYVTHDQEEAMAIADQLVVLNKGKVEQVGAPHEVYHKPKTEFVASFLGGANILDGSHFGQGSKRLVVRPEAIRLTRAGGKHNATVTGAVFLGSRVAYTLESPLGKLAVDSPCMQADTFSSGEKITFDIEPTHIHVLTPA